jgi:hypothetical protein
MTVKSGFSKSILLVVASIGAFSAGIMFWGINVIPQDNIAVKTSIWCDDITGIYSNGVVFTIPFLHTVRCYPLSDTILLINYQYGNFDEVHAVINHSNDGYLIRLNLEIVYRFDFDSARSLITKFNGRIPKEILEYNARKVILSTISSSSNEIFQDASSYANFLEQVERDSRNELEKHSIFTKTWRIKAHDNALPERHAPQDQTKS